jgi:hypothetical protein
VHSGGERSRLVVAPNRVEKTFGPLGELAGRHARRPEVFGDPGMDLGVVDRRLGEAVAVGRVVDRRANAWTRDTPSGQVEQIPQNCILHVNVLKRDRRPRQHTLLSLDLGFPRALPGG